MADKKFCINLNIDNIGPHFGDRKIEFADEVNSSKSLFFAMNGTGKSFISRVFRLTNIEKQNGLADDLLTMGETSGSFSFNIVSDDATKKLAITIKKGEQPSIVDSTNLIFHVFNSDFIEENIKPRFYAHESNIEGYILGKTQIDLTAEREMESQLKIEIGNIDKEIDEMISCAKKKLRDQGVIQSTTEFELINEKRLRGKEMIENISSFDEIVAQLSALSKVPEKIDDIEIPSLSVNLSVFNDAVSLLSTLYPKTKWDEEFVSLLKTNRSFIEAGLDIANSDDFCPFCRQPYGADTLKLINDYKSYLADKEAAILRQIELCEKEVNTIISDLKSTSQATKAALIDISRLGQFFPSISGIKLEALNLNDEDLRNFASILEWLELKSNDLSKVFPASGTSANVCRKIISDHQAVVARNAKVIKDINKKKQDSNGERLALRRNLCKAQYVKYQDILNPFFREHDNKSEALSKLQSSIIEKEQQTRVSKRDKVYETLTLFLNHFFAEKYTINKETFQIRFLGNNLGDKVSSVLSDGEKSIVAFCFYLASTHILLEREDDYNRLFFIIDDPVSSMDFHYVYAVAQSLRDIKTSFGITTYDRVWVFTHNMEFLSIMARNNIINRVYVMKPGSIEVFEHQLLLPYESHLKDIVEIANEQRSPSHTVANSIRHVLETVCRFEYPCKKIEKYIADNEILSRDSCIFTLCQDLSHGGIRNQQPFSSDVLVTACKTVEEFMKSKYEGQISAIPIKTNRRDSQASE